MIRTLSENTTILNLNMISHYILFLKITTQSSLLDNVKGQSLDFIDIVEEAHK